MAEIKLKLKNKLDFPLEADSITPDKFAGKSSDEIKNLPVYYGNEECHIYFLFEELCTEKTI